MNKILIFFCLLLSISCSDSPPPKEDAVDEQNKKIIKERHSPWKTMDNHPIERKKIADRIKHIKSLAQKRGWRCKQRANKELDIYNGKHLYAKFHFSGNTKCDTTTNVCKCEYYEWGDYAVSSKFKYDKYLARNIDCELTTGLYEAHIPSIEFSYQSVYEIHPNKALNQLKKRIPLNFDIGTLEDSEYSPCEFICEHPSYGYLRQMDSIMAAWETERLDNVQVWDSLYEKVRKKK